MSDDAEHERIVDRIHLMDNASDGDPFVWFCPSCMSVTVEVPPAMPRCAECGAPPCPDCTVRRMRPGIRRGTMSPPADDDDCEAHEWPTAGLPERLFEAMASPSGVVVCEECVERARDEVLRALTGGALGGRKNHEGTH